MGTTLTKQETLPAFGLNGSITHLLHRAQQIAVNQSATELAAGGLTIRQFAVLAAACEQDGMSQSELVDATGIDRSTLADMVARMEKGGLLKRVVSKTDARAKVVSLTARGVKAYRAALPLVEAADSALLSGLRKSTRESLITALGVIAGAIESDAAKPKGKAKDKKSDKKKKKKKKK